MGDQKNIQNIYGKNAQGKQIGKMRDHIEGKIINIGLSADEVEQIIQAIGQLQESDRKELEVHLQNIKEAKTDDEKKSLAQKAAAFVRERGWGIFDSLVANGILAITTGS